MGNIARLLRFIRSWLVFHISCLWALLLGKRQHMIQKGNEKEKGKYVEMFSPKFRDFVSFGWVRPTFRPYRSTFGHHSSKCDVLQSILLLTLKSDSYSQYLDYTLPEIISILFFICIDIFTIYLHKFMSDNIIYF